MNSKGDENLGAQILRAFAAKGLRVDQLPEGDPARSVAERLSDAFTEGTIFLKLSVNHNIHELGALLWDLVGSLTVPVGIGPDVNSLTLAVVSAHGIPQATIFVPYHWQEMIDADWVCQLGAMVYIGSQARDFYNDRLDKDVLPRAQAYEAEFLLTVKEKVPSHPFNEWQLEAMKTYPQGLQSENIRAALYTSKPFVGPS
jgi:hypothetical protein